MVIDGLWEENHHHHHHNPRHHRHPHKLTITEVDAVAVVAVMAVVFFHSSSPPAPVPAATHGTPRHPSIQLEFQGRCSPGGWLGVLYAAHLSIHSFISLFYYSVSHQIIMCFLYIRSSAIFLPS